MILSELRHENNCYWAGNNQLFRTFGVIFSKNEVYAFKFTEESSGY